MVIVKMFTKVICKKMANSFNLISWLHSKLDLFGEEKWKTFISFVGKVLNIFLFWFFHDGLESVQQGTAKDFCFGGSNF